MGAGGGSLNLAFALEPDSLSLRLHDRSVLGHSAKPIISDDVSGLGQLKGVQTVQSDLSNAPSSLRPIVQHAFRELGQCRSNDGR